MRRSALSLLAVATLAVAALAVAAPAASGQQPQAAQVTLTASVIDLSCNVAHGLSGAEHRMCSQVCSDRGIPLALLGSDGQIYIPVSEAMPGDSDNARLREFAEQNVTVVGTIVQRGGLTGIIIEEVRRS